MSRNPATERLAENLVILRRRAGLSQEELGYRCCLHRTEVGQLELGYREAKVSTLLKLCGGLEVSPNELLAGIEWRAAPDRPLQGKFKVKD